MASRKTYNTTDWGEQLLFIETKKGEFSGYKQDFLLTSLSEVEKEFYVCTKCNGIMRNACRIGEEELLVCELCSSKEDKSQAMVKSRKKILELRTKCPLERRGCEWNGTIAEIKTHLDVCLEFVMNCTNKCDVIMKRSDLTNHCKSECQNRDINCKHCNVRMKFKMLEDHYKTCTEIPLLCPNECKRTFTRKEVELHVNNECPNTLLNCENECGLKLKRSEIENHNKNECQNRKIHCIQCSVIIQYKEIDTHNGTCPEFPLLCPNECLKNLIRKEVELHIENYCPNTMIECPYKEMGCEAVMKRCEIVEHEKKLESEHLKNVRIYFSNEVKQMKSNFKSQEQTYELKIEKLESKNDKLKTQIQELIENIAYPIVLRDEITKEQIKSEGKTGNTLSDLLRLHYTEMKGYDIKWNRQHLQLCFRERLNERSPNTEVEDNKEEFHFTIRIPYDKRKLEHINWPVNCKLTIHDIQSSHNSLVFESQIQEFKPPSEKNSRPVKIFFLAKVLKAQLCEERFRNGNDAVSFTLQMKDVNYFPCW